MSDALIEARDVVKRYERGEQTVRALDGASLTVGSGEIVTVVGPSGSGKTTLLNCLSGLDEADAGSVRVDGTELNAMDEDERTAFRSERMGFVFQDFNLVPVLTAKRNVAMPLLLQGVDTSQALEAAQATLERVGLADRSTHRPPELSGGQQQRVALARALVHEPDILWADEPTGNLDRETGQRVLDLLDQLNRERGVTIVIVSHDPVLAKFADRVVRMESGRIAKRARSRAEVSKA